MVSSDSSFLFHLFLKTMANVLFGEKDSILSTAHALRWLFVTNNVLVSSFKILAVVYIAKSESSTLLLSSQRMLFFSIEINLIIYIFNIKKGQTFYLLFWIFLCFCFLNQIFSHLFIFVSRFQASFLFVIRL